MDTDISQGLVVEVELNPNGNIEYVFTVNGDTVTGNKWSNTYHLLSPLRFQCVITSHEPGHSGLDIVNVSVNGKTILPLYLGLATPATSYLGCNGTWTFEINQPFYPWYHGITGQGWIA